MLGALIKQARDRSGISQRELAIRAGTSQSAVSRIEAGLEEPSFERFGAIMAGMGYKPTIELEPIFWHRAEPRRLLGERHRTPTERVAEGIAFGRFAKKLRQAGIDAGL